MIEFGSSWAAELTVSFAPITRTKSVSAARERKQKWEKKLRETWALRHWRTCLWQIGSLEAEEPTVVSILHLWGLHSQIFYKLNQASYMCNKLKCATNYPQQACKNPETHSNKFIRWFCHAKLNSSMWLHTYIVPALSGFFVPGFSFKCSSEKSFTSDFLIFN